MSDKSPAAIRMAAKSCLIRYLGSESPTTTLNAYLGQLAAVGWSEEAIADVEDTVLETLDLIGSSGCLSSEPFNREREPALSYVGDY